jgi:hypothetical protein
LRADATEAHYASTLHGAAHGLAALLTFVLDSHASRSSCSCRSGREPVLYLLRWFWWRVNAWCEVVAMITSFAVAFGFFIATKSGVGVPSHISLIIGVAVTTVAWIATAYIAPATDRTVLESFYRLVRPAGAGWNAIREGTGLPASPDSLPMAMLGWVLGCAFVYAALFGAGSFLYGNTTQGMVWVAVFAASGAGLARILPKIWRTAGS